MRESFTFLVSSPSPFSQRRRYDQGVLKYSWLALGVLLAFGAVVAVLPETSSPSAEGGVILRDVHLRLYPAQDPKAEWRFRAPDITFDPLSGDTEILKPQQGERWVRDDQGLKLDMTITTDKLTIDSGDNLRTPKARLYIPAECTTLHMQGDDTRPVRIDQSSGYSAPRGSLIAPDMELDYADMTVSFELYANGTLKANKFYSNSGKTCVNGRIVDAAEGGNS